MNNIRNITKAEFLKVYKAESAKWESKAIKAEIDRLGSRFDQVWSITTNGDYTVRRIKARVGMDKKLIFPSELDPKETFIADKLLNSNVEYVG